MSISDLPRQEIWGVIYLKLLENFHFSLPKTFLLLRIMGVEKDNLSLVLVPPMDTDPRVYQSAAKLCLAIKLQNVANVRTCIFKPTLLKINPKTSDMSFHI